MKDSKTFWNKSAPRYAKSAIKDEAAYQKKLTVTRGYLQPESLVLEFGCGTGSTALLHAPYVKHITATDISDKMLEIAEQKAKEANIDNVSFQVGSLDTLGFSKEQFDVILGLNILHLLEDVEGDISKVYDLLKPGGVFVSSTALIDDMNPAWGLLIPLMQFFGFAPYVSKLSKQQLVSQLTLTGFKIDYEWQPAKESVFLIAKKEA